MQHLGTRILETERLILRPFRVDDAEDMYMNWANNEHVTRYLTWPTHASPEVSKKVIDMWLDEYEKLTNYQWCIENKENHQAIGSIGVVNMQETTEAVEIGYCIGEEYWRHGIMTEALSAVIRFLFEEVGCNRIFAEHDVENPNSGRVMVKAGMTYEGTLKEAGRNNLGICDMAVYGITKKMFISHTRG